MTAAHQAFTRDLVSLAKAATSADLANPVRRQAIGNGWQVFKRQLHMHHSGEDRFIWPALADRLSHSENAQSVLAAMADEHARIDPLLAAVDAAFTDPTHDRLADVIGALATTVASHLAHEETDALPLIDIVLTGAEWKAVGRRIARSNGLSAGVEFFAWMLDGAPGRPGRFLISCLRAACQELKCAIAGAQPTP